jgi:ABC-type uncharacterized transport system substrate-binding protein
LNRPGGNITGVSFLSSELEAKRLGLLHELVPNTATLAVLMNPNFLDAAKHLSDVQQAGAMLGLQLLILEASSERDVDLAFTTLPQSGLVLCWLLAMRFCLVSASNSSHWRRVTQFRQSTHIASLSRS